MLIRQAKVKDKEKCVALACEFMGKYFPMAPPDAEHFAAMFDEMHTKHVLLVAEVENEVVGMLAAVYQPHPLNPNITILMEIAWYVFPHKRKTGAGDALLQAYAALKNTDVSSLSLVGNSFKLEARLEDYGFKLYEKSYVRFNRG